MFQNFMANDIKKNEYYVQTNEQDLEFCLTSNTIITPCLDDSILGMNWQPPYFAFDNYFSYVKQPKKMTNIRGISFIILLTIFLYFLF